MNQINHLSSNSSDEFSYSMFEDDCDNEMNKWFESFFYHVDQAVFYDKKLDENYEKIENECKVWNNLFKLKNIDLTDEELQRTIFTAEKLEKNKPQLLEQTSFESTNYQLMKNKDKLDDDEMKMYKMNNKKITGNKSINYYSDLNDQFDKITHINQIKQDYIRQHLLNKTQSNNKSDNNQSPINHLNTIFPIANNNLNRRKQLMLEQQQNKVDDTGCLYFYSNKKKDKKNNLKDDKSKIRTIKSIIKIDQGNTSNLILNSQKFIHHQNPKQPLILPPILNKKFNNITIKDENEAILSCDKALNYCSLIRLKNQELKGFNRKSPDRFK